VLCDGDHGRDADVFLKVFGCHDPDQHEPVALHIKCGNSLEAVAAESGMTVDGLEALISTCLRKLFEARAGRVRPHRDENVLCDWNAFMAIALARGSRVLADRRLADAAAATCRFILRNMSAADGGLYHHFKDGVASGQGTLDDFAFFVWALCETYQATFDATFLSEAQRLQQIMDAKFLDTARGGGYWFTESSSLSLGSPTEGASTGGVRRKNIRDGAMPSGNSAALVGLCQLAALAESESVRGRAEAHVAALWAAISKAPANHTHFLCAVESFILGQPRRCAITTASRDLAIAEGCALAASAFVPGLVVCWDGTGEKHRQQQDGDSGGGSSTGDITFMVCTGTECKPPVRTVEDAILLIIPKS
jgi:uncharacterized protein YyaL (SSP411 family)